jgi:hypothetical protein
MTWDHAKFVALDLETYLIEPGILAPKIVCGSSAIKVFRPSFGGDGESEIVGYLHSRDEVLELARDLLSGDSIIVGANIAYDFGCLAKAEPSLLALICKAYAESRVFDILIAQALHAIAEGNLYQDPETLEPLKGRYSLDQCVKYCLGRDNAKERDFWRCRYALLDNVQIEKWPDDAKQYPIDDAVNTLEVAITQAKTHRNLGDLSPQCETAFALHLGAMRGVRVDRERFEALKKSTDEEHKRYLERFKAIGFFDSNGDEDRGAIKAAIIRAYGETKPCQVCTSGKILSPKTGKAINCKECSGTGLDPKLAPRTATGGVSSDRDAKLESGDEDLIAFGDNEPEKVRSTYLPFLEQGLDRPLTLRPNVLVASGRTSYDGPIQQMPREGAVRSTFRARPGYVFCSVDYAGIELCTIAQVCFWLFGKSQMKETINASGDPGALHAAFAATMAGCTTEEMIARLKNGDEQSKAYRQASKAGNYGFGGGMGAAKFVFSKRKKSEGTTTGPDGTVYTGIRFCILIGDATKCGEKKITEWRGKPTNTPPLCEACVETVAEKLRPKWFKQWPEVSLLHDWVKERVDSGGELPCLGSKRIRGGLEFTSGANNMFQALAADGAKAALRALTRECYTDLSSPLWGTRPIFFAHDEIVSEMPIDKAHLAGPRKAEIMIREMRRYVPDVCVAAEPALMYYWDKNAKTVYDSSGKLIPWEPKK